MSDEYEGEITAAPSSLLAGLRQRRAEAVEKLFVDIEHPEWPDYVVRFRPVEQTFVKSVGQRMEKSKADDAELVGAVSILVQFCVGIYQKDADGEPIGDPSEWPKFDETLAVALGLDGVKRAVDIVRGFYLKDGNIFSVQNALIDYSGYARDTAREDYAGN